MKNYLFILLLSISVVSAQESQRELNEIATAEMKSASKTINLTANPNTLNYDITYHKLEFTVDPAVYFISGVVTTTYTALSNMSTVVFDLTNQLIVSSVKKDGLPLVFVQNAANELVITLPTVQTTGTSASVVITYSGAPATTENAFTASMHLITPVIYTLSEPFGARDWWPCKQDLKDKVSNIDVYITAPGQYVSVANGKELSKVTNPNGTKTTHFQHNHAIPAYLIAIAVTNYEVITQQAGTAPNAFPIVNYLYPESVLINQTNLNQTPLIMNLYEQLFETYPYADEKYGHAQFGWGGGMEHTTVSFMNSFGRSLIAHELAHQWFGDKLTCGTWNNIWLNEGFATYVAALVIEKFDGDAAFTTEKNKMITNITSATGGAVYLTDTEAKNVNRIFDSRLTYNKGAMVLNMLRYKLGSTKFFQGVKNYLADPNLAYNYTLTDNLKSHLEAVYGSSLTEFFNDWVYNQGYPTYNVAVQSLANNQVRFVLNQSQSHPSVSFFEMAVPVRVAGAGAGEVIDFMLNNTVNGEIFTETVPFKITSVTFDPNKNLISKSSTTSLNVTSEMELESVRLYPNPTTNILTLDLPNGVQVKKAIFYNVLGQKIKETESAATSWDVSSFAAGIHFINVVTNSETLKLRFIKN